MPDLLAAGVFLFLVGVVVIVILGLAYSYRRARAEKAEKMLSDLLAFAEERADVEPVARVIADAIRRYRRP